MSLNSYYNIEKLHINSRDFISYYKKKHCLHTIKKTVKIEREKKRKCELIVPNLFIISSIL